MIAWSNSFSAIEYGVRFLVLAPHVGQAIADVLIGPPHSLQVISRRTKDALAAKKAQGVTLGGLRAHGVQAHKDAIERAEQLRPVLTELAGQSARKIAAALNERKIVTPTGDVWHAATVIRVRKRLGLA
jgi:hypothetical protein